MLIPLIGGSYSARSIIANAQRSINYFPEANRRDSPTEFTLYQRPGRLRLASPGVAGQGRGLFQASNGEAFAVVGENVYFIDAGFHFNLLGTLLDALASQIAFADNGADLVIVDGSTHGYTVNLATHAFAVIVDPTGAFTGSTQLAYLDTFVLYNYPGTRFFGSTLSNTITFDSLYIAGKDGYPDPLVAMKVNRREALLFGRVKSEIWYDAGGAAFPFERLPGAYIEHGCLAPFSVASYDISTYWLASDLSGDCMVLKLQGYDVTRVSNHALEYALQQMKIAGADLSLAFAFCWQQNGHVFYSLNFPSGNQTWVYDAAIDDPTMAWHQEATQNLAGGMDRMRDGCGAFVYKKNLTLDRETGDLYEISQTTYEDQLVDGSAPLVCIRGFPHITQTANANTGGQPAALDGKRILVKNVRLNMEVGYALEPDQVVGLRWSWDRGATFGTTEMRPAGSPGQYETVPTWTQLGAQGRDLVMEVVHQISGPAAIQGAWADVEILNT